MHICVVTHEYPPFVFSGPGKYSENLVKTLLGKGHKVTVITINMNSREKDHEHGKNLEIYRLNVIKSDMFEKIIPDLLNRRLLFNRKLRMFFSRLNLDDFDLLHIIDEHDSYFLDERITSRIPVIVSVNQYYASKASINPLKTSYFSTDFPLRYAYYNIIKFLNNRHIKKARYIIANSKYTASVIRRAYKIPEEKLKVVYRGIDTKHFSERNIKGKYNNHSILFVGGNMERKGVRYLVKSLHLVAKRFPDSRLVIIGKCSGMYKRGLLEAAASSGVLEKITFINHVKTEEIQSYFRKANVFVLPAIEEALGQVLMEAMSTQTPVVASRTGGIPEVVIDKKTGLLARPKDHKDLAEKIIRVFEDPKMAEMMGKEGQKRVYRLFESERMVEETLKIYSLLKGG